MTNNNYPSSIKNISKVILDEITKYYPNIANKTYNNFGFPDKKGYPALSRIEVCLYIELLKAGAFE